MATAYRIDGDARGLLCAEVRALARDQARLPLRDLVRRADALRSTARRGGYDALARLAGALGDALAAHGRGATVRTYLDLMDDALGCPAADGDALLAAASVRLA